MRFKFLEFFNSLTIKTLNATKNRKRGNRMPVDKSA